jgi:hypothetical protein
LSTFGIFIICSFFSSVPIRRSTSSPSRRRGRSVPSSPNRNNNNDTNFAIIGPNDKFSQSQLYRLKQPVKDYPRVAKSQEYALLGKNAKFADNVMYPLRRPVLSDPPRVSVSHFLFSKQTEGVLF